MTAGREKERVSQVQKPGALILRIAFQLLFIFACQAVKKPHLQACYLINTVTSSLLILSCDLSE